VVAYALMKDRIGEPKRPSRPFGPAPILSSVASVLGIACLLALLATTGQELLPGVMRSNSYAPIQVVVSGTVWMFSVAALLVLWTRRPHSKLDLWLIAVMWAWIFDVALSAVFNAGRFDLGFYAGRIYGVLAATFVLLALLLEMNAVYARFARSLWRSGRNASARSRNAATSSKRASTSSLSRITGQLGAGKSELRGNFGLPAPRDDRPFREEFIYADDLESTRNAMRSARHGQKRIFSRPDTFIRAGVSSAWRGPARGPSRCIATFLSVAT